MWKSANAPMGALHISAIIVMVLFAVAGGFLGVKYKGDGYKRKRDRALSLIGFIFIAMEIFKIAFRVAVKEDADLRLISFQICSIPMYLLPWIAFMKEGKLKEAFLGYVSFQSFTSAFFYFVKPSALLNTRYIAVSLQSMIWHSLMVGVGIFAMISYGFLCRKGFRIFLYSYVLWVITAVIAMIADIILINAVPGTLVDLFYIAPNSTFKYPLLSILFKSPSPCPLYFICYLVYYFLGGLMVYGIGTGITALAGKKK